MNNFKKITIGALLAASAGCLVAAAGCSGEPDYYKLVFEGKGLDYVFQGDLAPEDGEQFINGYEVKAGVEVRFTLALSAGAIGTPTILLNGQELTPDEQGVYSFQISENSTVQATGLQETKKVTFGVNEWYKFYDEDGKVMQNELTVVKGESVKFKVWVSPYMKDEYYVTNGTEVLDADKSGFYTIDAVNANTTVNVTGAKQGELVQDESFLERKAGTGTADDPYILERPIDLFTVAALVNSDFYTGYNNAYYKLNADIDMKGEKLFVIGDMSNGNAIFCGNFDGDGHTVKNFYMTDEVVNQETFENAYLPFVGLFGYACATQAAPAVIKNLTLEDYEVKIHPNAYTVADETSFAGSLLAYGIGVQIENCNAVNGKVTSENDYNAASIIGGLVGGLQSAYDTVSNSIAYDAYVNGCSVDAQVTGSGFTVGAGGIAGFMTSADTQAIAYVSNCVTTGKVSGARDVGGVVGTLDRFSTVTNCYSSCEVIAKNEYSTIGAVSEQTRACAGGIVGFAANDSVINGCYSANTSVKATSKVASTAGHGAICGKASAALTDAADAAECLRLNNHEKVASDTESVFTDTLGWTASEWEFNDGVPAYKGAEARTVKITVKNGGKSYNHAKLISIPVPIYAWYQDGMDEYIDDEDGRSWGYYFDEALTQKVPYGYVPTANIDLYYGYADYSQVAGTYHLGATAYGIKPYFALDEEGGYSFRDGGMSFVGTYAYNGNTKQVTLYNSCLGAMQYSADQTNGSYVTMVFNAENAGSNYELNGKILVSDGASASLGDLKLTAIKESKNFAYGEYVNADGTLLIRPNGTAVHKVNDDVKQLTYTFTASGIELSNRLPVTVENGKVTSFAGLPAELKDAFAGVWKPSAASSLEYSFDGRGGVKVGGVSGTYEVVEEGKVNITVGGRQEVAVLTANGMNINGTTYYLSDGFTGSWYGRSSVDNETVELKLGGVGANGYGEAQITFSSGVTHSVSGQYSVTDEGVMVVYVGDILYGEISIDKTSGSAFGPFYSYSTYLKTKQIAYANAEFKVFDLFKGVWVCDLEGVGSINFTGKADGSQKATALVSGSDGKISTVEYSLSSATAGTVTIGEKTYAMSLNEQTNKIELSQGQAVVGGLAKRDAWYGVTLYEGEKSYSFNGNGNLSGTVNVSDGTTLQYTMGANGVPEVDGMQLIAADGGFEWNGKTLTFKTGFKNTWLMPVTNEEIVIGEVNSSFIASVKIGEKDYDFTFNPELKTLSCTQVDSKGVETVMVISAAGGKEISLTEKGVTEKTYICIVSSILDGWKGTYTAQDGATWVFDGHGLGVYGSGSATYTDKNGVKTDYVYTQNKLGMVFIHTGPKAGMVFKQVTEDGFTKAGDNKAYAPVKADVNYLVEARLNGEYYVFDGTGSLWKNEGNNFVLSEYGYKNLTAKCLVITVGQSGKKLATLNTLGGTAELKLSDYTEWTLKDSTKKYVFDITEVENGKLKKGGLWLIDGEDYEREYSYSVNTSGDYYLTDDEGKTYKMTLNQTDNTFILEEEKNETQD